MDKFLVSSASSTCPRRKRRFQWNRSSLEVGGKLESKYKHEMSDLLMQSYSQIAVFPHSFHINGARCRTHIGILSVDRGTTTKKSSVSSLDFDSKGIYLASVTKQGCLAVHDFEAIYCLSHGLSSLSSCSEVEEMSHLLHISKSQQLDSVRWNIANQHEVACSSLRNTNVVIYDIGYTSSEPCEVLTTRHDVSVHGLDVKKGFSDIAFASEEKSRLLASDLHGAINMWDRRSSHLPVFELRNSSRTAINSIQVHLYSQFIFGADGDGLVHVWDLRGGKSTAAFQNQKNTFCDPLATLKLAHMLGEIEGLKAQTHIHPKEVHSIDFDPSCPYQLAFHLDDGWSGVLDINKLELTHIHCPPPAWLNCSVSLSDVTCLRRPSWLQTNSIYVVGSASDTGIHLLDFYPHQSSPCHVDYIEDTTNVFGEECRSVRNRFIPLEETVISCATHPLNGTIVAGTKESSLLVISQKNQSSQCDD